MLLKYNPTNERQFNNGKGKSVRGAYQQLVRVVSSTSSRAERITKFKHIESDEFD